MTRHPSIEAQFNLDAALERLFSLQTFGIKLGTEPITALLEEFGNPHHAFPAVHVAGTNGKGSVCAMVASILQAGGLRVGLYTSPHLNYFGERIRVNGEPMSRECLAKYAQEMLPAIERHSCTFFEGTTAMGFRYFAEEHVDIAVIETGLGGRLDATNVLQPLVAAITSIGFDHMKHLGNTLEEIAAEKAGIIKPNAPAIIGHMSAPRVRQVFADKAAQEGTEARFVEDVCHAIYRDMTEAGTIASFMIGAEEIADVVIDLIGRHQIENARVALATIDALRERYTIDEETIRRGFGEIRKNTGIRGRFEMVERDPGVILDVAHNPDGARVLVDALTTLGFHRNGMIRFVFGAVQDKDVSEVMRIIAPIAGKLYAVRAENSRSLPADEIAHHGAAAGIDTMLAGTIAAGVSAAIADAESEDTIVICGSFFVVADAIEALEARNDAPPLCPPPASPPEPRRLSVKNWNRTEQPRERLMHLGAGALSDAELLAILLRTGTKGEDVLQVSRNLLQRFENLARISERDYRELQATPGIGPTKAVTLSASFEIARRIAASPFFARPILASPRDIARIYIPRLRGMRKEQFHVLILNSASQVVRMELVSEGSLNSSIVHPREVFRTAIVENAAGIIGLHNHPSGNPTPSREDISITRQLVEAGNILGIPFQDHIIIAGEEYVSLADRGYI